MLATSLSEFVKLFSSFSKLTTVTSSGDIHFQHWVSQIKLNFRLNVYQFKFSEEKSFYKKENYIQIGVMSEHEYINWEKKILQW